MSEFKFNCPVCGQHIATDSNASGAQIECPTCFQPIIVPQAPKPDSKYILSATQYIKPQPAPRPATPPPMPARRRPSRAGLLLVILIALAVATAVYLLRPASDTKDNPATPSGPERGAASPNDWQLDLADITFPDRAAAGTIHNLPFACDRAYVQGGALALRQTEAGKSDLTASVFLPVRETYELAQRKFNISTNLFLGAPRIMLSWKDNDLQMSQPFTNGYAMKLEFGGISAKKLFGKIYLCLPDASRSFVAGNFVAEIRRPHEH